MHPIIVNTLGGLSREYVARQLIFSVAILVLIVMAATQNPNGGLTTGMVVYMIICTVLYPYSRFVYESIVEFVMGRNVIFVNMLLMLIVKTITMVLCWVFAPWVAPIGLAYIYYRNGRENSK